MRLSPVLTGMAVYPFTRLTDAKRRLQAAGVEIIDFGVGEPREETPAFIREALRAALEPVSTYPLAEGLPELREAISEWVGRRFGARLDADTEIIPTLGSKEAIFSLAQVVDVAPPAVVAVTAPGYPVAARGAAFAGAAVLELPLRAENGFLPDLDAVDDATWDRIGLFWVNYPNNPTAATAPLAFYEALAERARRHDFVVASDEAYSEVYFGTDPPASALQVADRTNVVVFNTLSKRSSMPGYRSGFVAGDAELVAALKRFRPNIGTAPPEFVQRAAIAAWGDERHVAQMRAIYRAKREVLAPALEAGGLRHAGGDATFFLWLTAADADAVAERLLDRGVVLAPGSFFGAEGAGYLRLALVPTLEQCRRAAELIDDVL
jgi:succinyldiaminopimelate transaminase